MEDAQGRLQKFRASFRRIPITIPFVADELGHVVQVLDVVTAERRNNAAMNEENEGYSGHGVEQFEPWRQGVPAYPVL
jgi:hypothetical protein